MYDVQFQKTFILPPQKRLEFLGGWLGVGGFVRPNHLKKCMGLNWNVQRGEGGRGNLGFGYGYFLEQSTHCTNKITYKHLY